jgi:MoaA/NifB/PqqE/SkfB family radical SAM enzyme
MKDKCKADSPYVTCDLKLGYSCNNDCIHCVIADNREALQQRAVPIDLTPEEAVALLMGYKQQGASRIVFTGGEPTIRSDFIDLVRRADACGFAIGIQTNGRALASEDLCDELWPCARLSFTIALHGDRAAVHDAITSRDGSFGETVRGIQNLVRRDYQVVGKVVVSQQNIGHLRGILRLFSRLKVDKVNFAYPHALGNARKNWKTLLPRYRDLEKPLGFLIKEAEKLHMTVDFEAIPFCIIPEFPEAVSELQEWRKTQKYFTPVHGGTRNWNAVRQAIKAKGENCSRCAYDLICEGPWSEYLEYFGTEDLKPVTLKPRAAEKVLGKIIRICNS